MRTTVLLGTALLLLLAHFAGGSPVQPYGDAKGYQQLEVGPFGMLFFSREFKAKERSSVIIYGQGTSPMAVYVYDAHGNCVARDDLSRSIVSDDLALEWYPPAQGAYDIEIRNLGRKVNNAEIAIR